jgi:hypothetical protein
MRVQPQVRSSFAMRTERVEVRLRARATRASRGRAIVFLRHERPIPPQDRVRWDDADDARQPAPIKDLAFHGEAASLVVADAQPPASVRRAEDTVLFEQVVNDRLLLPVDPAGDDTNHEGERRRQRVHGGSVHKALLPIQACEIRCRRGHLGRVPEAQASPTGSNAPIVERSALDRVFAQDGVRISVARGSISLSLYSTDRSGGLSSVSGPRQRDAAAGLGQYRKCWRGTAANHIRM